jgi:membrane-associated phospholipid phosphatase
VRWRPAAALRYKTAVRLACALVLLAACSSTDGERGHFDAATWGDALMAQTRKPDQLLLELGLLEATAGLAPFDHQLQEEATENATITEGSTANGDGVAVGLTALALGQGIADAAGGDDAHSLEVLGESFLLTEGVVELLKHTVNRERPSKDSKQSFPSGHTSYAFNMATFLQRRMADSCDGWAGDLGYLAYVPAAYVGIDRIEANRHWPSDVAFGAFLGVLLTNVVYDAHYGTAQQAGIFGVRGLSLEPAVMPDGGGGLSVALRF